MKIRPALLAGGAAVVLYLFFKNKSSSASVPASSTPYNPSVPYSNTGGSSSNTGMTSAQAQQQAALDAARQQEIAQTQAQADLNSFNALGGAGATLPGDGS